MVCTPLDSEEVAVQASKIPSLDWYLLHLGASIDVDNEEAYTAAKHILELGMQDRLYCW